MCLRKTPQGFQCQRPLRASGLTCEGLGNSPCGLSSWSTLCFSEQWAEIASFQRSQKTGGHMLPGTPTALGQGPALLPRVLTKSLTLAMERDQRNHGARGEVFWGDKKPLPPKSHMESWCRK